MSRSKFRRRKNGPNNAVVFGYRAASDPRNAEFFGSYRTFQATCEANRAANRQHPLQSKHQPGETGRQLSTRLSAERRQVEQPTRKPRAKKVAA